MGILDTLKSILAKTPAPASPDAESNSAGAEILPLPLERRTRPRVNARDGTKVLIIDDSPTIVAVFRKILRTAGYVVLEALDAEQGLDIARRDKPELIFLDIVLPGMNGFAALRHLRRDPLTREIPVIMISGNEQATEQFFGTRIGADDFMKKPFSRYEVFARIERLLDAELIPRRVSAPPSREAMLAPVENLLQQQAL
ncbi:PleD family two-component system response regulator [Uliginosibacterium sp. 31-12]|jgi:twitching motility two-component system response regulator PilH|uniref:response regulator n=1 Tax=Uliginosibacterium sp. 31-12 TaxID=3062781 RepID=UPI0026E2EDEB|nr:response regulator [Uliginosibacterium sp. 31-12]MDO6384815.1 response regulator [Uliginosibacterium sp. 31-12]